LPSGKTGGSQWAGRGSRHERGYGSNWVKLRKLILDHDGYICQPCKRAGRLTPATEVDHIKPKAQGGDDGADNCEAICHDCHMDKTKREAAEAQGRSVKQRLRFDAKGNPIWPDGQ
jgi:5-methylcytosine-specific restriction endonuclease McrA